MYSRQRRVSAALRATLRAKDNRLTEDGLLQRVKRDEARGGELGLAEVRVEVGNRLVARARTKRGSASDLRCTSVGMRTEKAAD